MTERSSMRVAESSESARPWHAMTGAEVEQRLQTRAAGLAAGEVAQRLAEHGPNRLVPPKRHGPLMRFLLQFHNVLLYVLLAAAIITAALGHVVDTVVLLLALVVNAVIGFIQEGKAESALAAIRAMLSPRAMVVRGGERGEIDADQLVPGDRVVLISGDRVPADLRLVAVKELRVDESALTGESLPAEKSHQPVDRDAPLGDRVDMAYSGTVVVYGQAEGYVVATGAHTQIGRINAMLAEVRSQSTPLLRQVDDFGRVLAVAILALCAATFAFGTLARGHSMPEMFLMVVALAASAIPEGLPAIMTVTLAMGVQRMARRRAIVRRLPAVEALGSVTVICSDKTGTLTRNEMTVQRVVCAGQAIDVTGVGYAPQGEFQRNGKAVSPDSGAALALAVRAGVACNDARLKLQDGAWHVEGDPTEGALLALGSKAGLAQADCESRWPRLDSIPFESQHRFMATFHKDEDGAPTIFVKGAPEQVLDMCGTQMGPDGQEAPLDVDYWRRMGTDLAAKGLRLLGMAVRRGAPAGDKLGFGDVKQGFCMLALVGIIDPPREEVIAAVRECYRAGIRVKMITGDHGETAKAIGAQLGIGVGKAAMTGAEVAVMDEDSLRRVAMEIDVFARASPEHKLRLVQALQEVGQIVSMTGDGVNDAPALKRADVGVAMGLKGTEAAKEAADMVLADDNFSTIATAVREGRGVYDNLKKYVLFTLPTNGGQVLVVLAAILFGLELPMTPAQVLWINMVTSVTLGLALAFEPAEPGIMDRPPRAPDEALLSPFFLWRIFMVSMLIMAGALGLFLWELRLGSSIEVARTVAVNTVVVAEMFYLFNSRSIFGSVLNARGLLGNRYVLIAIAGSIPLQVLYTYAPFMQKVFDSAALDAAAWMRIVAAGAALFLVAEFEKLLMRRAGVAPRRAGLRPADAAAPAKA